MRGIAVAAVGAVAIGGATPALAEGRAAPPTGAAVAREVAEPAAGAAALAPAFRLPGVPQGAFGRGAAAWRGTGRAAAPAPRPEAAEAPEAASVSRLGSAVFNVPSGTGRQQNAIAHHVNALTEHAPKGSLVRIALYQLTSPTFARLLVAAKRRGVRVQLVVDAGTTGSDAYQSVARALGTDRSRPSWVVACHGGCIGDTIMHNKFFLFSRTGRAADVVVQSSANLTTRNRVNAWNNAFTISDPRLYRFYGRYFDALAARHHQADHYRVTRSGRVTAYTFPRAGSSTRTDTLYRLLGHVGCTHPTSVLVTTFNLTRTAIAERLWSLAHRGCDVRVIFTNLGERAGQILTREGGPKLLSSHYEYTDPDTDDDVEAFVHSKYVLINGTYAGSGRKMVITGSPNDTVPGLRHNDEAMLTIDDARVYDAYQRNFVRLWHAAEGHARLFGAVHDPG